MKYLILTLTMLATASISLAQAPQHLDYQGILRDADGEPLSNETVTTQFSILEGSSTGTTVYAEEQTLISNAYGLIQTKIGTGTVISGSLGAIQWNSASHFIKLELNLGDGLEDFGTSELSSVPYALYGADEDADPENEIQSLSLESNILSLSQSDESVDFSGYMDNTDAQELSLSGSELSISGGNVVDLGVLGANTDEQTLSVNGTELSISDGNTVDLSSLRDGTGTDSQELTLTGSDLSISGGNSVDISSIIPEGGTDDQTLTLADNMLTLEDGGTVDLSAYLDDTDTQLTEEQVDDFVENNGYLTEETDDQAISLIDNILTLEDGGTVDLSNYLDNTDNQTLDLNVDNFLSIQNGGDDIDMSRFFDNTDNQALTLDGTTLSLENGGSVDLSPYAGQNTDSQTLSLSDDELALQNGGTVDLSAYMDNTDNQELALSPSNLLSIDNGATKIDLNRFMDNTDEQTLADVLSEGADANATSITNLADPTDDQDAATKAYVDSEIDAISTLNESGNFELSSKESVLLDIEHTDENGTALTAGEGSRIGQTFIPRTTGSITRINAKVGDPIDFGGVVGTEITVQILEGEGFAGSILGAENFTVPESGTNTHTLSSFNFTTPVAVSAGNTYTVSFEMTNGSGATHVNGSSSGSYADGAGFVEGSSTYSTYDLVFSVYIDPAEVISLAVADRGNVGIGTDSPDASAALEITSPNQGVLIPRMTTAQRDNIDSPATGLLIYNTEDNEINRYDGSNWLGETVDTDTDEQDLSNVLSQGADAGGVAITNLADPSSAQDAATKAYVDQQTESYDADGDINFEILDYAASATLDANFNPSNQNAQLEPETTIGQSFTALSSGTLTRVRLKYAVQNHSQGTYTLYVRNGQSLSGTVLYSETVTPTASNVLVTADVTLSSEVTVVAGQKYTISVSISDPSYKLYMKANYGNDYSGGIAMGSTSGSFSAGDNYFQTYVLSRSDPKTAIFADNENVGIFTNSPDVSAALDVSSTTGGLLLPRMTGTERDAISSPANGLFIYNTDTNKFQGYADGAWVDLN